MHTHQGTTDGFWAFYDPVRAWLHQNLAALNRSVEDGHLSPEEFVAAARPWLNKLANYVRGSRQLSLWEARKLIQPAGFIVSSVERHFQAAGFAPGAGLSRLPDIEHILCELARFAHHPPRDSHYTYWLWNTEENRLTFTGDPQEVFFNRAVCITHWLHTSSCDALRPICQGYIPVASDDAATALHQAAQNTLELHRRFQSFMQKDAEEPNRRSMEPLFFMTRMRTYLPTYPIGQGEPWSGVNAANLAAQMQMDYLLGTTNAQYRDIVHGRRRYMIPEDWRALEQDMALPSVADVLLQELRLTPQEVIGCQSQALAVHIAQQSPGVQASLMAYARLFHAAGKLTAMHWSLMQNYLIKPGAELSAEKKAGLTAPPEEGSGGMTHKITEGIMKMRREHPMVKKLVAPVPKALVAGVDRALSQSV